MATTRLSSCDSDIVKLHAHEVCKSQAHLDVELKKVLAVDGEGLMIKDPNCEYIGKRTKKLLKIKVFQDTEGTVVGKEYGEGRLAGMMGVLLVEDKKGLVFKIGTGFSDAQRRNPPKKGTIVTFKYQGLTKDGMYRFPVYLREHHGV